MRTIAYIQSSINDKIDSITKSKSKRGILTIKRVKEEFIKFVDTYLKRYLKNNEKNI